jgi:hypothetical protein
MSQWFNKVVIGMNLCPFAATAKVRFAVVDVDDESNAAMNVLNEVYSMTEFSEKRDSRIIALPFVKELEDFARFQNMVCNLEEEMDVLQVSHLVQISGFHPYFQFADSQGKDDPADYTSRAPFPTILLLRMNLLEEAQKLPGTDRIAEENADRFRRCGLSDIQQLFAGLI